MSNGSWYSKASNNTQKSNEERDFLLKTIEEQKDQLNRIQSKFKGIFEMIVSSPSFKETSN